MGFGYDDAQIAEKRHPTRQDLDAVSKDIPILIIHQSCHLGSMNSKALELAGITADSKDPTRRRHPPRSRRQDAQRRARRDRVHARSDEDLPAPQCRAVRPARRHGPGDVHPPRLHHRAGRPRHRARALQLRPPRRSQADEDRCCLLHGHDLHRRAARDEDAVALQVLHQPLPRPAASSSISTAPSRARPATSPSPTRSRPPAAATTTAATKRCPTRSSPPRSTRPTPTAGRSSPTATADAAIDQYLSAVRDAVGKHGMADRRSVAIHAQTRPTRPARFDEGTGHHPLALRHATASTGATGTATKPSAPSAPNASRPPTPPSAAA